LYVFNRNILLSVSDKYPQIYRSDDTGVQNLAPSPQGGFCRSIGPPQSVNPQIEMWNTRNQCNFYQFVFCFIL